MTTSSKQIDRATLKTLEPLNRLNPILLDELANKSIIDEVPAGRTICRHGDKDSRQIYLLSGELEVVKAGESKSSVIKTKTALTKPVAEGSPRKETLKAKTDSTLLYIDADLLELLMSDGSGTGSVYEVTEIDADNSDGDDWMLMFLQSPAFLQLPTENIQKLLTHLEEIPAKKDQVVIKQGGKDDNYYIIKSGSCNVHRQPHEGSASVLLAVLPTGSGFGEEALISNGARNATITMREDGSLMRLKKDDFLNLLINPLIPYFENTELQSKIDAGCVVIDVRPETESKANPLPGAVNIPLSMLRVEFDNLNAQREYLLVCNDGSQSAAAAFLMIQNGLKCNVLRNGLASIKTKAVTKKAETKKPTTSEKAKQQVAEAKKQTAQLAKQQEQIKAAREKAEQDIIKRKKELEESRARIAQKAQPANTNEVAELKAKASKELEKAQAESKAIELKQKETAQKVRQAEELIKQSATQAEQARKQAEEEAALIKQRALEEAEMLRAEKAAQELAKAQAERAAIEKQQQETNEAMRRAEAMMKQTTEAAEKARKEAELEAERIKQRAMEEAQYLRAEVEASRQKMEQDAARLKEEEQIIKQSALKIKNEADEIRREAMNEAQQVRQEIEETRALLNKKLQQTEAEEKRKHDAILAEAKKQADKIAATKTKQAAAEAEAIRQKAKQDALRLHNELAETRKQIEAEANQVINELKEKSKKAEAASQEEVKVIEEEVLVEVVADVDYKSVSIPGMSPVEPLNEQEAQRKAESIKAKLAESQANKVKVHKNEDNTILEGDDDLFIFKEPEVQAASQPVQKQPEPVISHRTKAEASLTQIPLTVKEEEKNSKSVVIYPQQEQESIYKNNPFLNKEEQKPVAAATVQQFNKDAYMKRRQPAKSNTLAIAASFLLILAGAMFTLHATNTLKMQSIAALFDSGNDGGQPAKTAIAKDDKKKNIKRKVLRADTKVNVKKKVSNKMDDIMQGWKNVLNEAENPKKK